MKKYWIAVAAIAFMAACNGKASQDAPVCVEEESIAVAEVAPETSSRPASSQKAGLQTKSRPINMRDSLKLDPKKGAVVQKRYKGTFPAADGPGIAYDLTLYYQQGSDDGVYELDATYIEAENGKDQTFTSTGRRQVKKGMPADASAIIYELIPNDGEMNLYFLAEGDSLTMLNQDLEKAASGLSYILKQVQ